MAKPSCPLQGRSLLVLGATCQAIPSRSKTVPTCQWPTSMCLTPSLCSKAISRERYGSLMTQYGFGSAGRLSPRNAGMCWMPMTILRASSIFPSLVVAIFSSVPPVAIGHDRRSSCPGPDAKARRASFAILLRFAEAAAAVSAHQIGQSRREAVSRSPGTSRPLPESGSSPAQRRRDSDRRHASGHHGFREHSRRVHATTLRCRGRAAIRRGSRRYRR